MSSTALDLGEMDFLRRLVSASTGVTLDPAGSAIAEVRLDAVARREGLAGPRDVVHRLASRPSDGLERRVVEALLNSETFFFRDLAPFEALRSSILPAAARRSAAGETLTIWSAACSTGQEPYSVAILVHDRLPALRPRFRIIASDYSRESLARARAASYSQLEVNRGLAAAYLLKYFEKTGPEWRLQDLVRGLVEFREINLLSGAPDIPPCDVILLRNVLIYLPLEQRRTVLAMVRSRLKPDGVLLLGASETTLGVDDAFEIVSMGSISCYRARSTRKGGPMKVSDGDVEEIVKTIWSLTLRLNAVSRRDGAELAGPVVASTVRLSGSWNGRVVLRCSPGLARRAAAAMFRLAPEKVSEADIRDAVGELTNMTAGNLRNFLPGACGLGLPRAEDAPGGRELSRAPFAAEGDAFEVRVLDDQEGG